MQMKAQEHPKFMIAELFLWLWEMTHHFSYNQIKNTLQEVHIQSNTFMNV